MNTNISETSKTRKFVLNLSQRLGLKILSCPSKFVYLLHVEKYKATVQKQ